MKPMLACDWEEDKVKFPLFAQPKIDGVRALNINDQLVGRSLKTHRNIHVTNLFSIPIFNGMDGEMACDIPTHPDLCRMTSGSISRIKGSPNMVWHVFDLLDDFNIALPYNRRYKNLKDKVRALELDHVRYVPNHLIFTMDELLALDAKFLEQGYEGTVLRDPNGYYKQGRSTVREGGLLRIKHFLDFEFEVLDMVEGLHNGNEAGVNELGNTERSSHKENMIPNGLLGSIQGKVLKDVRDRGKIVLSSGDIVTIGPGKLTHEERKFYFDNQNKFIGKIGKGKFFPKGIKDKPRFPTFLSIREGADIPPYVSKVSQQELF